jgi:hypothetical protein
MTTKARASFETSDGSHPTTSHLIIQQHSSAAEYLGHKILQNTN